MVACLATAAFVYVISCVVLPRGFFINDLGTKYIQMKGLIATGYTDFAIPWPGRQLDPSFEFKPLLPPYSTIADEQLYVWNSFPFAIVCSAFFQLFGFNGLYILPVLSGVLALAGIWALAGLLPSRRLAQPLSIFIAGFCTPMWHYSISFWEHAPAAALAIWSIYFWMQGMLSELKRSMASAGALCALALYFRDELYVLAACLCLLPIAISKKNYKPTAAFFTGLLVTLFPLWLFNAILFGGILGLHAGGAAFSSNGVLGHLAERWSVFVLLLINANENPLMSLIIGLPFVALFAIHPSTSFKRLGWAVSAVAVFALVSGIVIFAGQMASRSPVWQLLSTNGFFSCAPVLIFAAFWSGKSENNGLKKEEQAEKQLWILCIAFMALYTLIVPEINVPGIHWGCRYWLPFYGILAAMASSTIARWMESTWRKPLVATTIWAAIAISACVQIHSVRILYKRQAYSQNLNQTLAADPSDIVIALGWFVPQDLALVFYEKKILLAKEAGEIPGLLKRLANAGIQQVAIASAQPLDIQGFTKKMTIDDGLNFVPIEIYNVKLGKH